MKKSKRRERRPRAPSPEQPGGQSEREPAKVIVLPAEAPVILWPMPGWGMMRTRIWC